MREPQGPWFAPGSADPGQPHGSSPTAPQGGGIRARGRQKPAALGRALTPSGAQQTAANGTESRHKPPTRRARARLCLHALGLEELPADARPGLFQEPPTDGTDGDRGRV